MLFPLLALSPPAYRIVDLGVPPGAEKVEAVAINNRGEVLVSALARGFPADAGESRRAFLWLDGRFLDLGEPPYVGMERTSIHANALNDHGAAVGACGGFGPIFMSGLEDKRAFVWNGHKMALFFPGDSIAEEATDINDLGDIVGTDGTSSFARLRGKVWSLPTMSHLEPRDPSGEGQDINHSYGIAINARRQILMNSTYGTKEGAQGLLSRPFLVDGNDRRLRARPVPLPKGYREGIGLDLNASGTVFAVAEPGIREGAFPYLARRGRVGSCRCPRPSRRTCAGRHSTRGRPWSRRFFLYGLRMSAIQRCGGAVGAWHSPRSRAGPFKARPGSTTAARSVAPAYTKGRREPTPWCRSKVMEAGDRVSGAEAPLIRRST